MVTMTSHFMASLASCSLSAPHAIMIAAANTAATRCRRRAGGVHRDHRRGRGHGGHQQTQPAAARASNTGCQREPRARVTGFALEIGARVQKQHVPGVQNDVAYARVHARAFAVHR